MGSKLDRVCFQHAEPHYVQEYERIFAVPVRFDAPASSIHFRAAFLDLPIRRANPYLRRILSEHATRVFSQDHSDTKTSARVTSYVTQQAHEGGLGVEQCARSLGMSRQTLHRRLRREGTTYRETVESTRKQMAINLLADRSHSVEEISALLGFAEPSSFSRAFKRWTGEAPSAARSQSSSGPAGHREP